jgi:hypothetical protein
MGLPKPTPPYGLPEMSDDVLVKVDNVSKRFCRSLKRSLWYGRTWAARSAAAAMAGGADCRRAAPMCSCGRTSSGR